MIPIIWFDGGFSERPLAVLGLYFLKLYLTQHFQCKGLQVFFYYLDGLFYGKPLSGYYLDGILLIVLH